MKEQVDTYWGQRRELKAKKHNTAAAAEEEEEAEEGAV